MNLIVITTGSRPELLSQTLRSLKENAADFQRHTLTVVIDDPSRSSCVWLPEQPGDMRRPTLILNDRSLGASASRNIGAGSIPKYRRQRYVCFFDDDVYAVPDWDSKLQELLDKVWNSICTGHAHPFNGSELVGQARINGAIYREPLVISSVNMAMSWEVFDRVGWFLEPGGPGGSEDWNYCDRAVKIGIRLAITEPETILHTGQHSSSGKEIVGYSDVCANNQKLLETHGLSGKVIFS